MIRQVFPRYNFIGVNKQDSWVFDVIRVNPNGKHADPFRNEQYFVEITTVGRQVILTGEMLPVENTNVPVFVIVSCYRCEIRHVPELFNDFYI